MLLLGVAGLWAPAATGHSATSPALAGEAAARVARSAAAVAVKPTAPAPGHVPPSRTVVAASVSRGLGATRFYNNVLAIHNVWVGRDGGLVSLDSLVLDKGTVLIHLQVSGW